MSAIETLRKAREVLVARGWYQGDYCPPQADKTTCPVCALGAINVALGWEPDNERGDDHKRRSAIRPLLMAIGVHDVFDVPDWNDTHGLTVDDVIYAFDEAIAIAEGMK